MFSGRPPIRIALTQLGTGRARPHLRRLPAAPRPEPTCQPRVGAATIQAKTRLFQCCSPPSADLTRNCCRPSRRSAVLVAEFQRWTAAPRRGLAVRHAGEDGLHHGGAIVIRHDSECSPGRRARERMAPEKSATRSYQSRCMTRGNPRSAGTLRRGQDRRTTTSSYRRRRTR